MTAITEVLTAAGTSLFLALREELAEHGEQKTLDDLSDDARATVQQALSDQALILIGMVDESKLSPRTRKHYATQRKMLKRIIGQDAITRATSAAQKWLKGAGGE